MTGSSWRRCTCLACVILLPAVGCGYRPARATLPGGHSSVRVELPNPGRVGEPDLPRLLVLELCRQLSRAGVRASTAGPAATRLTARILGLEGQAPVVTQRRIRARRQTLRLELKLLDRGGATLWRSGLVEVAQTWALSASSAGASELSRQGALQELAARAARDAVERLLLGP